MTNEKSQEQINKETKQGCLGCLGFIFVIFILGSCINAVTSSDSDPTYYEDDDPVKDAAEILQREIELEEQFGDQGNE